MATANKSQFPTPTHATGISVLHEAVGALTTFLRSAKYSSAGMALVLIASVPLYAIGYQSGAFPLVGFGLALTIGAFVTNFILVLTVRAQQRRFWSAHLVPSLVIFPLLVGLVVAPLFFFVVGSVYSAIAPDVEVVAMWVANEQAYAWKPLWHIGLGAILSLGMAPMLALLWPLQLRTQLPVDEAMVFLWSRIENVYYSGLSVRLLVLMLAFFVAPLPLAAVVIPPVAVLFQIRLYKRVF